jgi:hypothetical protein
MFRLLLCSVIGGIGGLLGYVLGAALFGELIWSLVFGGLGFAIGFVGWGAIDTKAHADEHPTTWKT